MSSKYEMTAQLTANMVVEVLAERHAWSLNETLSKMSKTGLFERLLDPDTKLWMDNPLDIADLFDKLFEGRQLTLADYFP
jgi:hypothetical protein